MVVLACDMRFESYDDDDGDDRWTMGKCCGCRTRTMVTPRVERGQLRAKPYCIDCFEVDDE